MIDWDLLDELSDAAHGVRAAIAPELSSVYVSGEGDNPRVMIIGEAPGAQEEIKKRPFVGPAGRVLRELMSFVDLFTGFTLYFGEPNCWITNVVKFRPPRNRTPTHIEIMGFRHLLRQEWEAIGRPDVIVPVGGVALTAVKGRKMGILRVAGKQMDHMSREGVRMAIWPMIHPSFGLRHKSLIPMIEKDWETFGRWLKGFE